MSSPGDPQESEVPRTKARCPALKAKELNLERKVTSSGVCPEFPAFAPVPEMGVGAVRVG